LVRARSALAGAGGSRDSATGPRQIPRAAQATIGAVRELNWFRKSIAPAAGGRAAGAKSSPQNGVTVMSRIAGRGDSGALLSYGFSISTSVEKTFWPSDGPWARLKGGEPDKLTAATLAPPLPDYAAK
jgi:hypothetical protein